MCFDKMEKYKNAIRYYKKFLKLKQFSEDALFARQRIKELKEYMGSTPMIIIIKNKKIVYGTVGTISENALNQLASTYGV